MRGKTKCAPPNSIVFISDVDGGEPPEHMTREMVHSSPSCVSVGCYPEIDGETEFTLGPAAGAEPAAPFELAFDGVIATPSRQIMISDIDVTRLLSTDVPDLKTRIRIWVNSSKLPDKVVVGWG